MVSVFKEFIFSQEGNDRGNQVKGHRGFLKLVPALCKIRSAASGFGKIQQVSLDGYCQKKPNPLKTGSGVSLYILYIPQCSFYFIKITVWFKYQEQFLFGVLAVYLLYCGQAFPFCGGCQEARARFMDIPEQAYRVYPVFLALFLSPFLVFSLSFAFIIQIY